MNRVLHKIYNKHKNNKMESVEDFLAVLKKELYRKGAPEPQR